MLANPKVLRATTGFICVKPYYPRGQEIYRLTRRICQNQGVVLVLFPNGTVAHKFIGSGLSADELVAAMRTVSTRSPEFVRFYFTLGRAKLSETEVARLLARLGHDSWGVRERATREAIALGNPAYYSLSQRLLGNHELEVRMRLQAVVTRLDYSARMAAKMNLARSVPFLSRLLDHEDVAVRKQALRRAAQVLPFTGFSDGKTLRQLWAEKHAELVWRDGRYVDRN